jgi:hypothetical protein
MNNSFEHYVTNVENGDRFFRLAYLAYQFVKISRSRLARLLNVSLASLESHLIDNGFSEVDNEEISLSYS